MWLKLSRNLILRASLPFNAHDAVFLDSTSAFVSTAGCQTVLERLSYYYLCYGLVKLGVFTYVLVS